MPAIRRVLCPSPNMRLNHLAPLDEAWELEAPSHSCAKTGRLVAAVERAMGAARRGRPGNGVTASICDVLIRAA